MILENRLNITDAVALARAEEKLSKAKAKKLFQSGFLETLDAGSFEALSSIHHYLFDVIYPFAGKLREVNISKGGFRFAPISYLEVSLKNIEKMPQTSYDEIIEKYVEMNIAHPFGEGNGRSMRIWLDHILKKELGVVVDWSEVDKDDYLLAMERSPIKDIEIKHLLKTALSDKVDDSSLYMRGIDTSYYFEGYTLYKTQEIEDE
jgi:cell filamentation protein